MQIILLILGIVYLLSPYDIFPEGIFSLPGYLDDFFVISLLTWLFFRNKKKGSRYWRYSGENMKRAGGEEETKGAPQNESKQENILKTPYEVLGLKPQASMNEVKKAYRELSHKYHPDKVSHLGEEFKEMAEKRFKEIQEAYETIKSFKT